ncbi:E3 ubiquitin-protein ligase TTC3 [Protopterus annectens]|uniref:E3 ubiquitin-protein ligase TTC3 n=1 Tax=Protopterus annectens TaxID=7888 RepID=UPI001CFB9A8D|nr:E3 ubiquitin-protein ligase TTC3 [Protopterus annectens]
MIRCLISDSAVSSDPVKASHDAKQGSSNEDSKLTSQTTDKAFQNSSDCTGTAEIRTTKRNCINGDPAVKKHEPHKGAKGVGAKAEPEKRKNGCSETLENNQNKYNFQDVAVLQKHLKMYVSEAHNALTEQRYRNAEQSFNHALNLLDPMKLKEVKLVTVDYVVLLYGHASALLGIGQPEELTSAEKQFNRVVDQFPEERLHCLAFYGIGRVYFRQNRFMESLDKFSNAITMVNRKIVPGILTWPMTTAIVEESRTENLKSSLESYIEDCKFPPPPDAVCCYKQCSGYLKIQIYYSDPDFKGFVRLTCCHLCNVEFHVSCWKKLKACSFSDKNTKDFLQSECFTPDCGGLITRIVVYGPAGLKKCEFESKPFKTKSPSKVVVKQKISSLRKLKMKEEQKQKRKLRKEALKAVKEKIINEPTETSTKACFDKGLAQSMKFCGDRILQRIIEVSEQIKMDVQDTANILKDLLFWQVINNEEYERLVNDNNYYDVMDQLINLLSEKNNRIKTRIFLRVISNCKELHPKVQQWAQRLRDKGLQAAQTFFSKYWECIKESNFTLLIEQWDAKYGNKPDIMNMNTDISTKGILEYFQHASPEIMLNFIWMLEEKREAFPSLHHALDEYFDLMDSPCVILKKQDNEDLPNNGIKVKNKSRKKKQKESKSLLLLSGGFFHEDDTIFTEDDALMFLHENDEFMTLEDFLDPIQEFGEFYGVPHRFLSYNNIFDNIPDPTRESLYDYFTAVLQEHGPLALDDKLLVGEFEHFPTEAQVLVEQCGGLKCFLLESLRFVIINNKIGLMKDAVKLQENATDGRETEGIGIDSAKKNVYLSCNEQLYLSGSKPQLNPSAKEFKPVSGNITGFPVSISNQDCSMRDTQVSQYGNHIFSSQSTVPVLEGVVGIDNTQTNCGRVISFDASLPVIPSSCSASVPVLASCPAVASFPSFHMQHNSSVSGYNAGNCNQVEDALFVGRCSSENNVLNKSDNLIQLHSPSPPPAETSSTKHDDFLLYHDFGNLTETSLAMPRVVDSQPKEEGGKHPVKKMVAVQVEKELVCHTEVNTDPYHPFEKQQGDILRTEKEHSVLQEQLKEGRNKFEQLQAHSNEETSASADELKVAIERNQISKKELDWLLQEFEVEVKKCQQEKKEYQEAIKALKNKLKMLNEAIDKYLKNIDKKDQEYKTCLDNFLEISNKSAVEKLKLEENIKKGNITYKDALKRSVTAEVSVLESRRSSDLWKLQKLISDAEVNLKKVKAMENSNSTPAIKTLSTAWESYISSLEQELFKVESQFEEKIDMVKSGERLSSLSHVQITVPAPPADITNLYPSPPGLSNSTEINLQLLPELLMRASSEVQNKHITANPPKGSKGAVIQPSSGQVLSSSHPKQLNKPVTTKKQSSFECEEYALDSYAQQPINTFEKIIARLTAMFPHYSRAVLANFIREVRSDGGGTLAGMGYEEIIGQVTELILDHQEKTRALLSSGYAKTESSSATGHGVIPKQNTHSSSSINVNLTPSSNSTLTFPAPNKYPSTSPPARGWGPVKVPSSSQWHKSSSSTALYGDDPCIICHEDLSQETLCVLECRHGFHKECIKAWLKEQSTCPTCRVHALLPEDFPVLRGRIKTGHV